MKIISLTVLFITILVSTVVYYENKQDPQIESIVGTDERPTEKNENVSDPEGTVHENSIPEEIKVTSSGLEVDLSGRGLTRLDMDVFQNTNATTLDLSNNNLSGALQAEVRHLQNLEVLDLSNNNFTGVPAEVGQLKKLRVLDLSNNPITGLPNEIGNLSNLEVLDLRGTQYSEQDLAGIQQSLPSSVVIQK
jgi:Leucine-rich repeat (LRR) protein